MDIEVLGGNFGLYVLNEKTTQTRKLWSLLLLKQVVTVKLFNNSLRVVE